MVQSRLQWMRHRLEDPDFRGILKDLSQVSGGGGGGGGGVVVSACVVVSARVCTGLMKNREKLTAVLQHYAEQRQVETEVVASLNQMSIQLNRTRAAGGVPMAMATVTATATEDAAAVATTTSATAGDGIDCHPPPQDLVDQLELLLGKIQLAE